MSTEHAIAAREAAFHALTEAVAPAVLKAVQQLTAVHGRCYVRHLVAHPVVVAAARGHTRRRARRDVAGKKLVERCLDRLQGEGAVVRIGPRSGYRSVVAGSRRGVTLLEVWEAAETLVGDLHRRNKLRASAALIAQGVTGKKKALGEVGIGHLLWDSVHRRWAILPSVEQWSRELRGAEPATTEAHRTYAAMLLDLGADAGLLKRDKLSDASVRVEIAALQPLLDELVAVAVGGLDDANQRALAAGLRVLGQYIARRGWVTELEIDWTAVRDAVVADRDDLTESAYSNARWVYNRLVEAKRIEAEHWGRARGEREGLVSHRSVVAAANEGDWSGWVDADGRPYAGLLGAKLEDGKGGKGLRAFMAWLDARNGTADLHRLGLPARARLNGSEREQVREAKQRKRGRPDFERSPASLEQALSRLNAAAGFAARELNVDWTEASIEVMTNKDFAARYAARWAVAHGKEGGFDSTGVMSTLQLLARVASPFLAAQATGERRETLCASSGALLADAESYRPRQSSDKLARKVRQWSPDGEAGYLKLLKLIELLDQEIVALAGNVPLEEQLQQLEAGTLKLRARRAWASTVRLADMLDYASRVPARSDNIGALRIDWVVSPDPGRPWEGPLRVHYPDDKTKSGADHTAWLARDAQSAPGVRPFNRTRHALYRTTGGARDILLTPKGASEPVASPYLYVANAAIVEGKDAEGDAASGYAWNSVSTEFHRMVNRLGKQIGLRPSTMTGGAKGIHIIRHLFATFFLPTNALYASKMLGHASPEVTRRYYAWVECEHFDHTHETALALAFHGAGTADVQPPEHAGYSVELEKTVSRFERGLLTEEEFQLAKADLRRRFAA